jgi:hypothetical protein
VGTEGAQVVGEQAGGRSELLLDGVFEIAQQGEQELAGQVFAAGHRRRLERQK